MDVAALKFTTWSLELSILAFVIKLAKRKKSDKMKDLLIQ